MADLILTEGAVYNLGGTGTYTNELCCTSARATAMGMVPNTTTSTLLIISASRPIDSIASYKLSSSISLYTLTSQLYNPTLTSAGQLLYFLNNLPSRVYYDDQNLTTLANGIYVYDLFNTEEYRCVAAMYSHLGCVANFWFYPEYLALFYTIVRIENGLLTSTQVIGKVLEYVDISITCVDMGSYMGANVLGFHRTCSWDNGDWKYIGGNDEVLVNGGSYCFMIPYDGGGGMITNPYSPSGFSGMGYNLPAGSTGKPTLGSSVRI